MEVNHEGEKRSEAAGEGPFYFKARENELLFLQRRHGGTRKTTLMPRSQDTKKIFFTKRTPREGRSWNLENNNFNAKAPRHQDTKKMFSFTKRTRRKG